MFYDFSHRHASCLLDGQPSKVILSRENRGGSLASKELAYNGVFAPDSPVKTGSHISADEAYFVLSVRPTAEADKYCSLLKINTKVEVQRWAALFDAEERHMGSDFLPVVADVPAVAQFVTARLRQDDAGLLPTTAYVLYVQNSVDVRRPQDKDLTSPDRVLLNGRGYQVDAVDDIKVPGLLHVQLSEDVR
ncbi:hypothetical protein PC41400_21600 [Paenibacillus chitinolyticus]|uniref:Uncharacterized protein n=1 Tax=Paenibacillus chitinolyticus TaxID=79263 RepID=A0A410X0K1_9BACL|nr:hypothetical protein [Paenibacillus chitinolyticus]MCY9593725.1 hypothetical protein [Paenibacillus chitinolyticus]MCY9599709.1 hypothetical protein [Paenibacillus chitinolyticus]QAV20117.1 hypothetical protein PC41400_21600 [Paenibacillus chitinolyticus]